MIRVNPGVDDRNAQALAANAHVLRVGKKGVAANQRSGLGIVWDGVGAHGSASGVVQGEGGLWLGCNRIQCRNLRVRHSTGNWDFTSMKQEGAREEHARFEGLNRHRDESAEIRFLETTRHD